MVEFYLLTFPRFPLRKKEHESYFGKNRTNDFRTSRCARYLLDHSGDLRAPIWCPSGGWRHARGREHCCRGEPGSNLSGGYAPDSAKVEGSSIVQEPERAEPLCARITDLNREVSEEKADV